MKSYLHKLRIIANTLFLLILPLLTVTAGFAATRTWLPTAGGAWTTAANWSGGVAPVAGDDVIINSNQSANITAVPTITLNSLAVSGNSLLAAGSSGNTLTITTTLNVSSGITFTMGVPSGRMVFTLNGTGTVSGNFAFDAGGTVRNFTVNGTLIVNPSGRVYDPNLSPGGVFILNSGATLKIGNTGGISTGTAADATVAINFGGSYTYSSGANYQYIGTAAQVTGNGLTQNTPANVTINNNAGVTLSASTTISGSLIMTAGSLNLAANTMTAGDLQGSGNITKTSGAGVVTLTVGSNNASTAYSGIISNSSGTIALTKTGSGALTLSGNNTYGGATTLSAGTLNINSATAIGTGPLTISGGTIDNTSGGALTLSNNNTQNWNGNFAFTGTQNLNMGTGAVAMNAARTVTVNGGTLTVGGVISGAGFRLTKAGAGTLTLSGANAFTGGTTLSAGTLNINNAQALGTAAGTFIINGGTFDNTTGGAITTLNYPQTWGGDFAFTGTQNLNLGTGAVSMTGNRQVTVNAKNLTVGGVISGVGFRLTKAGAGTLTLSGTNTFTGGTTLNAGTLNINNAQALGTVAGSFIINGGTFDNTTGGAITTLNYPQTWGGDFTYTGTQNLNLGTGAVSMTGNRLVTVNANTLTVGGPISGGFNLTKAGAGILSFGSSAVTVNNLSINGGTLISTSGTLSVGGNFTNNGTFSNNNGTVLLNGSVLQSIGGSSVTTFNNLTLSNPLGAGLGNNATVNGVLALGANVLSTGSNVLTLGPSGSITRTTGYVNGNLQRTIPTGPTSMTFDLGSPSAYLPVTLTFGNVTTPGTLIVSSIAGDHPNLSSSTINPAKSVNRYWTITNSGVAFTTYNAIFNFSPTDLDAGIDTSKVIGERYNSPNWSPVTIGTLSSTSVSVTGLTSVGDFAFGDIKTFTLNVTATNGSVTKNPSQANYDSGSVVQLTPVPNSGYHFVNWTGDATGSANPLSVTMDGNKNITANFAINTYTLGVTATNGTVGKNPDQVNYDSGSVVQLTPVPNSSYHFVNWTGDATGSANPLSVTMDGNKTITANFAIDTFTVTASAGANGTISPSGAVLVTYGASQSFTITPNTGYHIADVLVDGSSIGAVSADTFTNVTANHTIAASFAINTYTLGITATNGSVAKNPDQANYDHGTSVQLTATPSVGYNFVDWSGDATGSANPLSVTMDGNKNITANFAINTYTLNVTATNGTVAKSPDQASYNHGALVDLTPTPSAGYHFVDWSGDASGSANPLSVTMDGNKTITANFAIDVFTINASASTGGSINPSGSTSVNYGEILAFAIAADNGYHLDSLFVDGVHQDSTTSYTFTNVTASHSIHAVFGINVFTISASATTGGSITPSGDVNVNNGETLAFAIAADNGYHLDSLFVDGVHQDSTTSYTFTNVTASHSIHAVFGINVFTINASATTGGSISPSGNVSVNYGATLAFAIAADNGYHLDSLFVDGVHQDSTTSYTFTNVTASHSIHAVFGITFFAINASATTGGSITPSGNVSVNYGATLAFAIAADDGYHLDSLFVDGLHQDSTTSFTFVNVTSNHSINAKFAVDMFTITATADSGGTITPSGAVAVAYGGSKQFSFSPNAGFKLVSLFVDGIHEDSTTSYTFENVKANHSIAAHFAVLNHPPTAVRLLLPANNDTLRIDSSRQEVKFVWSMSSDVDNEDTLLYALSVSGPGVDTTIIGLSDTSFSFTLPGLAKAAKGVVLARLQAGATYLWTVHVTDGHVTVASPDTFSFQLRLGTNGVADGKRVPTTYALYQNYPNPFNPTTHIEFDLPRQSQVTLKVYNLLGAEVSTLIDQQLLSVGVYKTELNGTNLASGIYFYRLVAEGENGSAFVSVKKLMLIK